MIMIVDIPRVLIQQMLHLVLAVNHHQQRSYRQFTTGTRGQIAYTTAGILSQHGNKPLYVASLNGLARSGIHLAGILIRRIMGEIAAHHEQVFVRQIRLQRLGYPFQLEEVVRRYNDGYDRWHLTQSPLQERQLHLQTVLPVVCLGLIAEDTVGGYQFLCRLDIDLHFSQRSGITVERRVH